ncbi:MAG: hypothetical protein ACTSVG_04215 [Alphaproteobacteria bacterium]
MVKTAHARTRINGPHPELAAPRLKMSLADLDGILAQELKIREAEAQGPMGRGGGSVEPPLAKTLAQRLIVD